jgi:outer membrane protein assembly factor BamB
MSRRSRSLLPWVARRLLLVLGVGLLCAGAVPTVAALPSGRASSMGLNTGPATATPPTVSAHRGFAVTSPSAASPSFRTAAGNTIVVFGSVFGSDTLSVSDSLGNPFTSLAVTHQASPAGEATLWVFAAYNVSGGSADVLSASLAGSTTYLAAVDFVVVQGVGPQPLDHLGAPSNYTTAQSPLNASAEVASQPSDLVLGAVAAHAARNWESSGGDVLLGDQHAAGTGRSMTAADFSAPAAPIATWVNATVSQPKTYWLAEAIALRPVAPGPSSYSVTFAEAGLPLSQAWYVDLGGVLNGSTGTTVSFVLPNGTYSFAVGPVSGYLAAPSTGSVVVNGTPQHVAVTFTPDASDWPTYLGSVARDSANYAGTTLNSADARNLTELWSAATGGIQAEPVVANDTVYIGADNGNEYALNASTGATVWQTYLGQVLQPTCNPYTVGITSSATVSGGFVYVGGGNLSGTGNLTNGKTGWYALDEKTGAIAWDLAVGNISQGSYNWASPLIADGYAYIGNASRCDRPLVWGGLLQVSLATHEVVGFFNTTVGSAYRGASIWGSPTFNAKNNTVFFTTGNPLKNYTSDYSESVVAINATTLAPMSSWQVPLAQTLKDSDFGTTPAYLHLPGGRAIVVAMNKNGITYALNATNLSLGPLWETHLSFSEYPENVAPLAWGDGLLFNGAGPTTVDGKNYSGSLTALDPANGSIRWQVGMPGDVYGAPVYTDGVVVAAGGTALDVFNASTGALLWNWTCGRVFYSAPSVAEGRLYAGCEGMYAFGFSGKVPGGAPALSAFGTASSTGRLPSPGAPNAAALGLLSLVGAAGLILGAQLPARPPAGPTRERLERSPTR